MKTITVTGVTYDSVAGTIVIVGSVADQTFAIPPQQITVENVPSANTAWSRAIRMTNSALQVIRFGKAGIALDMDTFAGKVGPLMEPTLSWPIVFTTQPVAASTTTGNPVSFTVAVNGNEVTTSYQWQVSDDDGNTWANVTDGGIYAGATTVNLTITPSDPTPNDNLYQCIAQNGAGNVTSASAKLTVTAV